MSVSSAETRIDFHKRRGQRDQGHGMKLSRFLSAVILLSMFAAGCRVTPDVMYRLPVDGTDRILTVRRIPTGPLAKRLELRLESKGRSVLLHELTGDWYDVACGVAAKSPGAGKVSYLVNVWGTPPLIGAYDIDRETALGEAQVDLELLRHELYRMYQALPDFPTDTSEDLVSWAKSSHCQGAFHARFGYADK